MFASLRIATFACISLAIGALASPHLAHAQSGSLPNGAAVTFEGPWIHQDNKEDLSLANQTVLEDYFNFAHCECSRVPGAKSPYYEDLFAWRLAISGTTGSQVIPAEVWLGTECNVDAVKRENCTRILTIDDISARLTRDYREEIPIYNLLQPDPKAAMACPQREGTAVTWFLADTDGTANTYEYTLSKSQTFDSQPPPLPKNITAKPGEGAVKMSWTAPTERSGDAQVYQFFCATEDGNPAFSQGKEDPEFQTAQSLCNGTTGLEFVPPAEGVSVPDWLARTNTESAFICGEVNASATSYDIGGLRVGVPYQVAMVAVDKSRNAVATFIEGTVTPVSVIDFWEDIHDQGSDVEGGLCLLATTYGNDSGITRALRGFRDGTLAKTGLGRWLTTRYYEVSRAVAPAAELRVVRLIAAVVLAPAVAVALLWHFASLPGCLLLLLALVMAWRRRKALARLAQLVRPRGRAAVTAAAALGLIAFFGGRAQAQSMDPYWDDQNVNAEDSDPYEVNWHAGIRLGPYTPAIDAQFGGSSPGPYEAMFGGYGILPMLDVDYIILETRLGQIGAGGSIGYFSKEAKAYQMGSVPGPDRPRSAENNSFRMIPMAATAVFRMTYLDTQHRIPIVPYVRGGLAYHLWWVEKPNGDVASVCRSGGTICDENKARGGSLGLVGSLGLAVRAEAIDFEAASAMREGGIMHAGFYAEVSASKVDDFGSGNKLAVGDVTWFAGVDFEF